MRWVESTRGLVIRPAGFLDVWLTGYVRPLAVGDKLAGCPAPHWGFYAQAIRAALDSLLLYLPLALMGRQPSTPLAFTLLPAATYYRTAVGLGPLVLLAQWLIGGAVAHVVLRLAGRRSDIDRILNLTGFAALTIGAFLLGWDWLWFWVGPRSPVLLGTSHLVADGWAVAIVVAGLKRRLDVPVGLGLLAYLLAMAAAFPLGVLFMRPPF